MPETNDTQDGQEQQEKSHVRMKREDIEALERSAAEAKQLPTLQKELAFAKAGVDTDSKLGKMLFQTYEGELTKEAIVAEAQELGLLEKTTATPDLTKEEKDSTKERQQLNNGAAGAGDNPVHPKDEAKQMAEKVIQDGGKYEQAAGAYVSTLVKRFADGDTRAARNPRDRFAQ